MWVCVCACMCVYHLYLKEKILWVSVKKIGLGEDEEGQGVKYTVILESKLDFGW